MKKLLLLILPLVTVLFFFMVSCDEDSSSSDSGGTGTLNFTVNGEGFVNDGFTSEDGWDIEFSHVYVNIEGPTAYQVAETSDESQFAAHAGHPHASIPEGSAHVALTGEHFVDLKAGDRDDIFSIGEVTDAPVGNYNYLNFNLRNIHTVTGDSDEWVEPILVLQEGDTTDATDYEGYCLILIGTADNGVDPVVSFTIKFDQQMAFSGCGPQEDLDDPADDIADGILSKGGTAKTQMTFHFDHVFGDVDEVYEEGHPDAGMSTGTSPTDPNYMNFWGIGFDPFADLGGSTLEIDSDDMKSGMVNHVYFHLYTTLKTLGHLGEAHCGCEDYNPDAE